VQPFAKAFEMNILRLHEEVDTMILLLFILVVKNKINSVKIKEIEANIVILCFIVLLLVCYAFRIY